MKLMLRVLAVLILTAGSSALLSAQGYQQINPDPNTVVMLETNVDEYGDVGAFNGPEKSRIYFQIKSQSEVLFIKLSPEFHTDGFALADVLASRYYFRISKRIFGNPSSDPVVYPGPGKRFAVDLNNANVPVPGGAYPAPEFWEMTRFDDPANYDYVDPAYDLKPFRFSVAEMGLDTGTYFIEFTDRLASTDPVKRVEIGYWDFTVVDTLQGVGPDAVRPGRVYSRLWGFRTPGIPVGATPSGFAIFDLPECAWNQPFTGVLYSYTSDQFVSRIDFADSGFQGLSFNVAFNRLGPRQNIDGLSAAEKRKSVQNQNLTVDMAEHLVFLEAPDTTVFPSNTEECGRILDSQLDCAGNGQEGFIFTITSTVPGQVEGFLDFGQDGLDFSPGSPDVALVEILDANSPVNYFDPETGQNIQAFQTQLFWDGIRGDGLPIQIDDVVDVEYKFSRGVQHWGMFDVEFMKRGFCIETVRPVCEDFDVDSDSLANNTLYYDDTDIFGIESHLDPAEIRPKNGVAGCPCDGPFCRAWDNFQINSDTLDCSQVGDNTTGYGDKNTLNTWWFAYVSIVKETDVEFFAIDILGDTLICEGQETELTAVVVNVTEPVIYEWTGPNGFSASGPGSGPVSAAGTYFLTVSDAAGCMKTDSTTIVLLDPITFEVETTPADCDAADGSIEVVNVMGGTGLYEYCIDNACQDGPLFEGLATGAYDITVRDLALSPEDTIGCTTTIEVMVEGPLDTLDFYPDTLYLCLGEAIQIQATDPEPGFLFSWTPIDNIDDPFAVEPFVSPTQTTLYNVIYGETLPPASACDQENVLVIVSEPIGLSVDGGGTLCTENTTLTASSALPVTFEWRNSLGDLVQTSPAGVMMDNLTVPVTSIGEIYTVTATYAFTPDLNCTATVEVSVIGGPVDFSAPGLVEVCEGDDIDIAVTNNDPNQILTYAWTASTPGLILSGADTASPEVDDLVGDHTLYVSIENQFGCPGQDSVRLIVVDSSLVISFVAEVQCTGARVDFTNNSSLPGYTYVWNYGDGVMDTTTTENPSHVYTAAGSYTVILDIINEVTCVEPDTVIVEIGDTTLVAGFSFDIECFGDEATVSFTNETINGFAGGTTYAWIFSQGTPAASSDTDPVVTVTESGILEARLIATSDNNCSDTITQQIDIQLVMIDLADTLKVCLGDSTQLNPDPNPDYQYEWSGTDGFASTDPNPTVTPLETATYTVTVLGIGTDTCSVTEEIVVQVITFPDDVVDTFYVCPGETALLSSGADDPSYTYLWTLTDGSPATGLSDDMVANPVFTGTAGTSYRVVVTETASGQNCTQERFVEVIVLTPLNLRADDGDVCEPGGLVTLTAEADRTVTFTWYSDADLTNEIGTGAALVVNVQGQDSLFYVRAVDEFDCEEVVEVKVKVVDCCPDFPIDAVVVDANCGLSDGRATVTLGGVQAGTVLSYAWSHGPTTRSVTGLAGGIYQVTVTVVDTPDDLFEGCTATREVHVNEIGGPVAELESVTPADCLGNLGSVTIDILEGIPDFVITWDGGSETVTATGLVTINDLAAGMYNFVITDSTGCKAIVPATVPRDDDAVIGISAVPTDVSECGAEDGSIEVTITGGTAPFLIYLDGELEATTNDAVYTISGLGAGYYEVQVIDSNECTPSAAVPVVINDVPFNMGPWTAMDASCSYTQGSLEFDGSGSTNESYVVTIAGTPQVVGATTGNTMLELNLPQGTYLVTGTLDTCVTHKIYRISGPEELSFNIQYTPETCNDVTGLPNMDGTIEVIQITGGTAPYEVVINNGAISYPDGASMLSAGTYKVEVIDAMNCDAGEETTITIDACTSFCPTVEFSVSQTVVDAQCDENNGRAQVYVQDLPAGTVVQYLWSNDSTGAQVTGLAPGIYTVTITLTIPGYPVDCPPVTEVVTVNVNAIGGPILSNPTSFPADCTGENGSITFSILEGTPNFTITWNGDPSPLEVDALGPVTFDGLAEGHYEFTVVDSTGCPATISANVGRDDRTQIAFTATGNDASDCGQADGFIEVSVSLGTPDFTIYLDDIPVDIGPGPDFVIPDLPTGVYEVKVTDGLECAADSVLVVIRENFDPVGVWTAANPDCPNEMGTLSYNGGGTADETYVIRYANTDVEVTTVAGDVADTLSLLPGAYEVERSSSLDTCVWIGVYELQAPEEISFNVQYQDETCVDDGAISVIEIAGGTPGYAVNVSNTATGASFAGPVVTELAPGTYLVSVVDALECDLSVEVDIDPGSFVPGQQDTTFVCIDTPTPINPAGDSTLVYNWSPETGLDLTRPWNPSVTTAEGITFIAMVQDTVLGCERMDTIVVIPYPAIGLTVSPSDTLVCDSGDYLLTATVNDPGAIESIEWFIGDASVGTGFTYTTTVLDQDVLVTAVAVDTFGCVDTAMAVVRLDEEILCPEGPFFVCPGVPTEINSNGDPSLIYEWSPAEAVSDPNIHNPEVTTNVPITLIVTIFNGNCSRVCEVEVIPYPEIGLEIEPSDTLLCAPDSTVLLTALANDPGAIDSIEWFIGGVSVGTGFTYTAVVTGQDLLVTAVAVDTFGCNDSANATILRALPPPCPPDTFFVCAGVPTVINTEGDPSLTYEWSPVGAVSNPNIFNPTVTTDVPVTLTVFISDGTCSQTCTVEIIPYPPIDLEIEPSDTLLCEPGEVLLTATVNEPDSIAFIEWFIGNTSVGTGFTYTATVDMDLMVTAIASDIYGCADTATATILLNPELPCPPDTFFVCPNVPTVINAEGDDGLIYEWSPASAVSDPNIFNPTVTTDVPLTLTVTISDENCSRTCTVEIVPYPPVDLVVTPQDTFLCVADPVTFTAGVNPDLTDVLIEWFRESDTNPSFATGNTVTETPPGPGIFTYIITATDQVTQCSAMDTVTITVAEEINLQAFQDTTICPGETVTLFAQSDVPVTYEWSTDPDFGDILPAGDTLVVNPDATTTYYVRATDDNDCSETDSVTVSVLILDVIISEPQIFCILPGDEPVETAVIRVTNNDPEQELTYEWSSTPPGGIISGQGTNEVVVDPTIASDYQVVITNQIGCTTTLISSAKNVDLSGVTEILPAGDPIVINRGEEVTLEVIGCDGCEYTWDSNPLDNSFNPDAFSNPVTVSPAETTEYTVVAGMMGCETELSKQIIVGECEPPFIHVPNAFTPNGDGNNDVFRVRGEVITSLTLVVYNRWGEKVFETNDVNGAWDGTFKNKELPPDVYGYFLRAECPTGSYEETGNVTILK